MYAIADRGPRDTTEVSGTFEVGAQYHFHMETQTCAVRPIENGQFDVYSSCQGTDAVQQTVAAALGLDNNKIDVTTRCWN